MKKTSVYIEPAVDIQLAQIAHEQGVSKAELIRKSLERTARERPRKKLSCIGKGKGPGDLAANVDRYLAESGFGEH